MDCCLCHSKEKTRLYKLCSNMKVMGNNFPECDSYVSSCNRCGLIYLDMDATKENYNEYYCSDVSNPIDYVVLHGERGARDYFEHLYDCVKNYIHKDSKILDIAGAKGEFMEYLKDKKGYSDVFVLEYSDKCIQGCEDRGIRAIKGDCYQEQEILNNQYDLVVLSHTLEHFCDIELVITNSLNMLKDDGVLFIEVPDLTGYVDYDEVPYFYYTYEHVIHMTEVTLENIARKFGLEILNRGKYLKGNGKNGGVYPSVYMTYRKGGDCKELLYDTIALEKTKAYLEKCQREIGNIMERYVVSQEPLILWGIGASTAQLLSSAMNGCNIQYLVDSNPGRQGIQYEINHKIFTIVSPETIIKENRVDDTILILPVMYKDSIEKQIRKMGLHNKVDALSKREFEV